MRHKQWTEKEELILIEISRITTDIDEINKYLPSRTRQSILSKSNKLNIELDLKMDYWSNEQIKLLIELRNRKLRPKEIALIMNKTPQSIASKALSLGLERATMKWDKDKKEELVRLINAGLKPIDIAIKMGTSRSSVQSQLGKMKLQSKSRFRKWTETEINILQDNYIKLGRKECAKLINRHVGAIGKKADELGLIVNKRKRPVKEAKEKYTNKEFLYQEYIINKKSAKQIGNEIGCGDEIIFTWLKKYNIPRRTSSENGMKYSADDDLMGKKFGNWTVISNKRLSSDKSYKRASCVICECRCKKKRKVPVIDLIEGKTHACVPNCQGYYEISGTFFGSYEDGAKIRDLPFEITIEYVWDLFIKQNRKCALSGIDICFSRMSGDTEGTASLDRIDSDLGYLVGNVQWVHKELNKMKWDMPEKKFFNWIEKIYNYRIKPLKDKEQENSDYCI